MPSSAEARPSYSCQCARCDGSGRYDRGDCFGCKGLGVVTRLRKPRSLTPFVLAVTYANGSTNAPRVFASSREKAVGIVARYMRVKGWTGTVV